MSLYSEHLQIIQQRFGNAFESHGYDSALIYSGHHRYAFLDDNSLPFKINPLFKYWLPLTSQQHSFIFVKSGQKPHLFLHQIEDYWHAQPTIPEGEWQAYFDVTIITDCQEVKSLLGSKLKNCAFIGEDNLCVDDWPVSVNPDAFIAQINYMRAYKTPYEIDCMRTANALAARAHMAAKQAFYAGKTELEVHLAYLNAIDIRESQLPYNNIIAFNQSASILHYDHYQTTLPSQRLSFLIDAGAEYQGYNADISRTYLAEGPEHAEFRALFEAYCSEYYSLLKEIQLGKSYLEFHDSAHRRIAKLLSDFELVNTSPEETYEKGYNRCVFPCGVGHYIGLQVHDVGGYLADCSGNELPRDPRYPFLRLNRPMEQDIVFTVEPGIYLIDQLLKPHADNPDFNWSRINQLKPYGGFRLEDCIALTADGVENLSQQGFDQLVREPIETPLL